MVKWLEGDGSDKDVVVSSRVRLARNIHNVKFPHMLNKREAEDINKQIASAIISNDDVISREFKYYRLEDMNSVDKQLFVEKHLISPNLLKNNDKGAFLLRDDEKVTIMINEEDHIRLQALLPGFNLEIGWNICDEIDDVIEKKVKYAFDEEFGYLTSCPTNVGTGIRVSVMMHLPCLVLTQKINRILQAVTQIGLAVRGLYGEGTNAKGNMFQISNQTTLGQSEEEIIQKLKNIVFQIISKERAARERILDTKKMEIEDKIYRSLGILKHSRIISSKESMKLLSNVKMGIHMGIISNIDNNKINNLMIGTQPANIVKRYAKELSSVERDVKRAELIRAEINT